MEKMIYYLSGSISNGGTKESTFERFYEAEARLQKLGHEVINPARMEEGNKSWAEYLERDLGIILKQEPTLYMLKGWRKSKGARLERTVAKFLKLDIEYEI